jgi:hypothetical protein
MEPAGWNDPNCELYVRALLAAGIHPRHLILHDALVA